MMRNIVDIEEGAVKRWWWIILGAVVLVALVAVHVIHENRITPSVSWASADPVLSPYAATELVLGTAAAQDTAVALHLPAGGLPSTDWFLPITKNSSVTYVLHDGQARWLVDGKKYNLASAPVDPVGVLVYAPSGQQLAWTSTQGISVLRAPHFTPATISGGSSPYFTVSSHLDYISTRQSVLQVHSLYPTRTLPAASQVGYHPFVQGGQDVVLDRRGSILIENLQSGAVKTWARVHQNRWPDLLDSVSYGSDVAVLLKRPTALPAYMVIVSSPKGTLWYRWQTGLKPQIGVVKNHLVINNLAPSGQLVTVENRHLEPLPQSSGLFSQSPHGIVFQTSAGFTRIASIRG